jgi:hypothetical protein
MQSANVQCSNRNDAAAPSSRNSEINGELVSRLVERKLWEARVSRVTSRSWTAEQIEQLRNLGGKKGVAQVAAALRKTTALVQNQVREIGSDHRFVPRPLSVHS